MCYAFHMRPSVWHVGGGCFSVFRLGGGSWGTGSLSNPNMYEVEGKLSASLIKISNSNLS